MATAATKLTATLPHFIMPARDFVLAFLFVGRGIGYSSHRLLDTLIRDFMQRSFTDRLLGGVCGGIGHALRLNSWLVRSLFVVLAVASLGAFVVFYLLLWWIAPQESVAAPRRGGLPIFMVLLLAVLTIGLWIGREQGFLNTDDGTSLYLPILAIILSVVFFLRQVRA
jgi:phage shock protein PspC (stress-responsive transcriptional regulator)